MHQLIQDIDNQQFRPSLKEVLSFSLAIVTVVGFVCTGCGISPRTTALISIATLLCFGGFYTRFGRKEVVRARLRSIPITGPTLIIVALFCILIGTLLRQFHINSISADVAGIADSLKWSLRQCWGSDKDACVAVKLSAVLQDFQPKAGNAAELLYSQQALGEIVRTSPTAEQLLNRVYGVDQAFLGTGFSQPLASAQFVDSRIPEYLVPNYSVSRVGLLVWRFSPETDFDSQQLVDALSRVKPFITNGQPEDTWKEALMDHVGYGDSKPAVVRFAQLPSDPKCLGKPIRHRVFFSHLGIAEGLHLTLGQAARLSGYSLDPDTSNNLYVFIYIPSQEAEVVPPTWAFILSDLSSQIGAPSLCEKALNSGHP